VDRRFVVSAAAFTLAMLSFPFAQTTFAQTQNSDLRFVPATPCRIADTRLANGPFGGPFLSGQTSRGFTIPSSACNIPPTAQAYSLNVTVVPHGPLGFLTTYPCGQTQPLVSTLNSDGRIKAVAAIVPAGTNGAVCFFVTNDTDLVLDIDGYFVPSTDTSALAFYPVAPCRLVDTRLAAGPLSGPSLVGNTTRTFPLLSSPCNLPGTAQAYSLNYTSVPKGSLGFLTTWPAGQTQPLVSTLNAPTGVVTANAAIVPAGANGAVSVFVTNDSDLVIDVNGYFAPPATGGLSLFNLTPCRVLDTRIPSGTPPFSGPKDVNVINSGCGAPAPAQSYVLNATVVPPAAFGFLTLWPQGGVQPVVSTLNASDGAITSNMALVPTTNGSVSAFTSNPSHLVLDISGYFAPPSGPPTITSVSVSCNASTVPVGQTSQCNAIVQGTGSFSAAVTWLVNSVVGGNGTVGTVSANGLYTAPANVPTPASVTIAATSVADPSKSSSQAEAVTLKISVTPPNPSIQVFHSQQFTATVAGVPNTAVQWTINGIAGGNSTLGVIDSTGFYTAPIAVPAPATIQVQATSVVDGSQSAAVQAAITPDTIAPQVIAVTPSNLATNVSLQPTIQVTFDARMDPSSLSTGFSLLQGTTSIPVTVGYDPSNSLVTLSPQGILATASTYTLTVASTVQDQSGNPMSAPFSASFTTTGGAAVPSAIVPLPGLDPTTLNVISLQGQNATPAGDGTFSASVRPQGTTAVAAMVPGESFGLFAISIGNPAGAAPVTRTTSRMVGNTVVYSSQWQISASPALAQLPQPVVLDFQTTAESLLFLSPALFHGDAAKAQQIMTAIAAEPKTAIVATALQAAWNTPFPLRDPNFVVAYGDALSAILMTLSQTSPPESPIARQSPLQRDALVRAIAGDTSGPVVYHPFDICCINVDSLALQGSNYVSPIAVNGPSLEHPFGNAAGWLVRVVQLPANFDTATIIPGTDAKGNANSPQATLNEGMDPVITTLWIDGDSLFDYTDLLQWLGNSLGGFLGSLAGYDISGNKNLVLPQPSPGTSTSYLLRAYSGGNNDPAELNLIATLPKGADLWLRARLANYTTAAYDMVDVLGVVPSGIMTCLASKGVQDQVTAPLLDPSSPSYIGGSSVWNGFVSTGVTIVGDFKNHFFECAASAGIGDLIDLILDVAKLATVVGKIVDGPAAISSAGHAIQIVREMEVTNSPVDTAYITITNNSVVGSASMLISPASPTITAGGQQHFSFVARDAQGHVIPNVSVVWNSSDKMIGTIDNGGLATGVAAGQVRITVTATATGASAGTLLNVIAPGLDHLGISPGSSTLHVGQTVQFSVSGVSSTGNPIALGPVNWTTSPSGIVSVSPTGLVTAVQGGSAFVNADSGGKSVAATVGVIAATPGQIVVTPANTTINVGSTFPLAAKAVDVLGNPISGVTFTWSLNQLGVGVVTVDPATGTVHGLAAGQATVTATAGGLSGSASITVLVAGSPLSLSGTASCTNGSPHVQLQWNNINAASYDLYRENTVLVPNIIATTLTEFGDLAPATTYDYFLKAHMPGGGIANSNIAQVAVPATCPGAAGKINVFPATFNPVFTVSNPSATLGYQISNVGTGPLTGTITANPIGGAWLTVDGHPSSNWVAPEGISVTADPTGLAPGVYSGTLTVSSTGATNSPVTIPVLMTIYPPLQIATTSVPVVFSNHPYSTTLSATGGSGTGYVWSLQSGTLPLGLTLDATTGVISGTSASISGTTTSNVNIGLQDSAGHFTFKTFAITWQESLAVLAISPSNFQFIVGSPYTLGDSITFQAAGGTPPYTWTATSLPTGLAINGSTGLITGTPTQPGTFQSNITVTDSQSLSSTAVVPLTVVTTPLRIATFTQSPANLPSGSLGVAYSQVLTAIGGSQSGYTWSVAGALPPGLTTGNSLGCPTSCGLLISGIPTQAGVFTFTAVVTDSLNSTTQQSVTIVINTGTPPQITLTPLPLAVVGQPYSSTLAATGGTPPYKWFLIGSGPDPAIQFSSAGVISGTPTAANDCPSGPALWLNAGPSVFFQVLVTDVLGQSSVHQICLPSFFPDPQITGLTPASVIVDGQVHTITVNGQNFRNNAFVTIVGATGTTFVNSTALSFTLTPSSFGAFGLAGGGVISEGGTPLAVLESYTNISNSGNLVVFDPPPTITSVSAVTNNTTSPCTTRISCQLVIQGSGLVFVTTYKITETNTTLLRDINPSTPIPWNTVTTSAFNISTPGTYTVTVTNPNQPAGGSATATAHFTVVP
jgi:Big-like domain-containing protein/putative Ig domain-containing protein